MGGSHALPPTKVTFCKVLTRAVVLVNTLKAKKKKKVTMPMQVLLYQS